MKKDRKRPRLELVGLAEAAEILGLSKASVWQRRRREWQPGDKVPAEFPEPIVTLHCGPIWHRADIEAYADEERRLRDTFDERIDAALHAIRPMPE